MTKELATLSDTSMQELLLVEMLQQLVERSGSELRPTSPSSPYFWEGHQAPLRHLALAARMFTRKNQVRLHPKSEDELLACLQKIKQQADKVAQGLLPNVSEDVVCAARALTQETPPIDKLISFGKLYYSLCLDALLGKD